MYPLLAFEVVAPGLYQVAHVTPHAWGIEAFYELLLEDGGFVDILPYLGILLLYALVFYALAVWRLRTVLLDRNIDSMQWSASSGPQQAVDVWRWCAVDLDSAMFAE